ncbi:mitotic spindle assembly checkpoint protein MAD2A-like [Tubulanus polymorphus]|uniref:mitotic spindle assembly checkpoint protein MAD2A-like n=1 Tax=Tubulanus polymorphus TaxID=672921 RepID=UPI003DA5B77E
MAATQQQSAITLKGSTEIVTEFFYYGVNSILYQRAIYPPESFKRESKYGLTLLVSTDNTLNDYLQQVLQQVKEWLLNMSIQKLVLVIKDVDTDETHERWQFDIECDKSSLNEKSEPVTKSTKAINEEIKSVIRQIVASVTFLPLLENPCVFDILVYTDKDLEVPTTWGESKAHFINNSEEVRLRSFSTQIHKVDAMVAYKKSD